jgi:DNA repair exonuclease SbcCD ATPase subunit
MKVKTTAHEDAPASVTATISEDAEDRIARKMVRIQEDDRLRKAGFQVEPIRRWEFTGAAPRESRQIADLCRTEHSLSEEGVRESKFIFPSDIWETQRGSRSLAAHGFRVLSEEEVAETFADARALQTGARIRRLQAPISQVESDLRRIAGEISNSEEILKSLRQRIGELEEEKEEKERNVERAKRPLEEFLSAGRSPEWKKRALEEASRDRDRLPPPERTGPVATAFGVARDRAVALNERPSLERARIFVSSGDAVTALRVEPER